MNIRLNTKSILATALLSTLLLNDSSAQQMTMQKGLPIPVNHDMINQNMRAESCAPATALRDLEWNNVQALIENGGTLWYDRAIDRGAHYVPKELGVSVCYGGALWLGGISPDQQLKLAAVKYRNSGNDFWPGPLTNDGTAEVSAETCQEYDQFIISYRSDAMLHRQYHEAVDAGTVAEQFPNGYVTPSYFFDYPAHGNTALNQDYYLAPFLDYDGDGAYNPLNGDYPWYDFLQEIDCSERRREDIVPLYGDQNFYWIFNDKGNIHSESQGEPIGMEIRAQAFAFATNDEVNNMTFYNYVLINQGTQTLTETYFAQWVDSDLGGHVDDYVGCDVQRGLGYSYNGDAFDEQTAYSLGYGENPPAMGVDFFEGPYQDADNLDNPLTTNFSDAVDSLGIPYGGIGIGYGDGVVDNERFGMRKFLYYNWTNGDNGQPNQALQYYNYMKGYWRNGQRMAYGGDGLTAASGAMLDVPADYMFPDDTDPINWGTNGVEGYDWSEVGEGTPEGDRLFLQSAGPFTLEPGDYNNITVGMLYARAYGGEPYESVNLLKIADDKAQALFDNCFEIVSGPDAPEVAIQELENELILYISNDNPLSNNYNEEFSAVDPGIPTITADGEPITEDERSYKFQGYQIYQLADNSVSATELDNEEYARLIFQCDIEDGVSMIENYVPHAEFPELVSAIPMVNGADEGIQHSFRITKDAFALGSNTLVNHKTYYFMAIAYGYNNYADYEHAGGSGQDVKYKASRKSATGSIKIYSGTPHAPSPESGGTIQNANYGDGVVVTRLEGKGNSTNNIDISTESEEALLTSANGKISELVYAQHGSPVNIRVVDPLMVPDAEFELVVNASDSNLEEGSEVYWTLINKTLLVETGDEVASIRTSNKAISTLNEQLILDWGISVTVHQHQYSNEGQFTDPIEATIEFDNPAEPWLTGVRDAEGFDYLNWIRSGTQEGDADLEEEIIFNDYNPGNPIDEDEIYEGILGGTWAPYSLVSYSDEINLASGEAVLIPSIAPTTQELSGELSSFSGITGLNNVDVVLTSDKSKWTRCPVLEMQPVEELSQQLFDDDVEKMKLRRHPSVDKNGRKPGDVGYNQSEANPNGNQPVGMSWFPGYAIDIGTGERLNMAFGEDSWLGADNGKDMLFNPSSRIYSSEGGAGFNSGIYAGGQHWIYIFKNSQNEEANGNRMPTYDKGNFLYNNLEESPSINNARRVFRSCTWVGSSLTNEDYPMLSPEEGLVPNDCRIRLRVAKQYEKYSPTVIDVDEVEGSENNWNPLYTFSTKDVATQYMSDSTLTDVLDQINVVPNPYYAYSQYETSKLDNRVKITNLPEECLVSIFNLSGQLIRQYDKADPTTSLDWDLKNHRNVPIAGGVYIIHVEVPGIGDRIIKWFGVTRPIDLDTF